MNKEKLDNLLENGSITQEEYDDLLAKMQTKEPEEKESEATPTIDDEKLEKLIQAKVERITSKLGTDKAGLHKQLEPLNKDKLTDDERKQLEISEKEQEIAERERALLEKENRLYAIKSIKSAGLDDGSDTSLELVELVLAEDTDKIDRRVKVFGELVKKFAQSEIDKRFKENGRNPNTGGKTSQANNPYAKDTYNLTEQMRLEVENPDLAKILREAAGGK